MRSLSFVILLATTPALAQGAGDMLLPVQGVLTDENDLPIDGLVTLTFRLYDAGNTVIYTEPHDINVVAGFFQTNLGLSVALNASLFDGGAVSLGITVDTDAELAPRIPLGTAPLAAFAQAADFALTADQCSDADTLQGASLADLVTDTDLTTALGGFVSDAELTTALGPFVTQTELDAQLAGPVALGAGTTIDGQLPVLASGAASTAAVIGHMTGADVSLGDISVTSLGLPANAIDDADVSDTLTCSIFGGTGSTTGAVDLQTAEVAGTLPINRGGTGGTNGSITAPGALTFRTGGNNNLRLETQLNGPLQLAADGQVEIDSAAQGIALTAFKAISLASGPNTDITLQPPADGQTLLQGLTSNQMTSTTAAGTISIASNIVQIIGTGNQTISTINFTTAGGQAIPPGTIITLINTLGAGGVLTVNEVGNIRVSGTSRTFNVDGVLQLIRSPIGTVWVEVSAINAN